MEIDFKSSVYAIRINPPSVRVFKSLLDCKSFFRKTKSSWKIIYIVSCHNTLVTNKLSTTKLRYSHEIN